jgi:lipopolysaccharide/colanic/teichoic acid biosynthesis glycosyltransferase
LQDTMIALGELTVEPDGLLVNIESRRYMLKLIADRVMAALVLLVLALPLLVLAVIIKLDSRGPIFHRQVRVGRRGRLFTMYKYRSMFDGASDHHESLAASCGQDERPIFKLRRDPRVTRLGRFLRRTSLDELPQLINVVQGHMSLVGPRPPLPREVELYAPWQRVRLEAVPGMTGLWQVSGRSELSFEEMVRLDREYIERWSLRLDWKILARTIPAVTNGRGAF